MSSVAVLCGLVGLSGVAIAADEPSPDMEFLEYLGSWDGSDEDWELLAETLDAQAVAADDGQTDGAKTDAGKTEEESVETDDET